VREHRVDAQTATRHARAAAKKQRVERAQRELTRASGRWRAAEHRVLQLQADRASEQRIAVAKAASRERAHDVVAAREAVAAARSASEGRR
jgi:hypothetical protein